MVKLIRLKSDTDKLYFNNNIQSDLVLKPNSKIALQNVSFKKTVKNITVDSTNKTIIYNNGDGDTTINLTENIYNNTDFNNLLIDMENNLNQKKIICNSVNPSASRPGIGKCCIGKYISKYFIKTASFCCL